MKIDVRNFITNPCLIAADIDKTFINHGCADDRREFIRNVAPELLRVASSGTNIAVVTGNSIKELTTRFLTFLIKYLEDNSEVDAISKFHFFCNSGGVYFHIGEEELKSYKKGKLDRLIIDPGNPYQIRSKFINREYLEKTKINPADIGKIKEVLDIEWEQYLNDLKENMKLYQKEYFMKEGPKVNGDSCKYPLELAMDGKEHVDIRYLNLEKDLQRTVQITIKPVLSWKHAINPETKFNNDKRSELINNIHKRFDPMGLTNYVASPGGNTSIDITKSKLDKSYAIRFLIDHLGIEGNIRKGEKYGSNVIYIGDEVIAGGGNDFPVTRIDGVLVLAVNKIPRYVPFKSRVIIPNELTGPDASALVLSEFNHIVQLELAKWTPKRLEKEFPRKNAIQLFKEKWFLTKIKEKIDKTLVEKMSTEEFQVLYTFISLISRNDESARKLTNILVNELDEIMEALDENEYDRISGIISSQ